MRAALIAVNLSNGRCTSMIYSGEFAITSAWSSKRIIEPDFKDCVFTIVADQDAIDARRRQMGEHASYDYSYSGIGTGPK